ncbi:MAG: 3-isopropylmalate dehydratase large subunit [Peptococcaceae bacterium]|jgi:3-isopropylmalate/(R)-2-methylmalate dehydratase large subunit|nr:3-isopropylmalate dehydratase large subunit [Peptococcaceae bacterium]MDH7523903.1 3-isopropylmalate dehydratase large subunit [Peptococcaceae bacterium]
MGRTIAEKLLSAVTGGEVKAGDLTITPVSRVMLHDATGPLAVEALREAGVDKVCRASDVSIVMDHFVPSPAETYSRMQDGLREFAREMGIEIFEAGEGICHQILPEKGRVRPGTVVIGTDSHTCTYGAIGAFATGMGSTDAAIVLATGKTWLKVPETIRVDLEGAFSKGVMSKDLVLKMAKDLGADGATYMALEIGGPGISSLSMDARFTVCNMGIEMGAKACLMETDETAAQWLDERGITDYSSYLPDPDAAYSQRLRYDLFEITPQVACPHTVENVMPVSEMENVPISQGVIGTCTNGRLEDLQAAADLLRGKKVAKNTRLLVVPASRSVLLETIKRGIIETMVEAGAMVLPPGCGPCVGGHGGIPGDGENVISTANRNFKGRMGNAKASIYLASPLTVAASVIMGRITDPRTLMEV